MIFEQVGAALTTWEMLEDQLADLFANLIKSPSQGARLAFGMVSSSTGRMDMLDEALSAFERANQYPYTRLRLALTRVKRLGARRNEIAHGVVTGVTGNQWFLRPARYNTRKSHSEDLYMQRIRDYFESGEVNRELLDREKYSYVSSDIAFYRAGFAFSYDTILRFNMTFVDIFYPSDIHNFIGHPDSEGR